MSKKQIRPLHEQIAVVFGASSGIGRVTAKMLAEKGATVVVAARGREGLDTLVAEITAAGGTAHAIQADAISFEEVTMVAEETVRLYGRLDTWVQNAAVSIYATFEQTKPEEFAQVIDVNLIGQMHGAKAALPHLAASPNGVFISVSSVESQVSLPYQSAYAASKHGLHGMIEVLRMELHHEERPVRLTEIMPASINTPLFAHAASRLGVEPKGAPPIYAPEEVAAAILHAATHDEKEIVVGAAGKAMLLGKRFAPSLTDKAIEKTQFQAQLTSEPRPRGFEGNLYGPSATGDEERGEFNGLVVASKAFQWALAGAALGTVAVLASKAGLLSAIWGGGDSDGASANNYAVGSASRRGVAANPDAYTDGGDGSASAALAASGAESITVTRYRDADEYAGV